MKDLGLIFDRTNADLMNNTDKAFIDYNDLNRVGNAIKYIVELANELGYSLKATAKTDWDMYQMRTQEEMDILFQNIQMVRNSITVDSDTPTINAVTYTSINNANNIERILYEAQKSLEALKENLRYSGEIYSGDLWNI